MPSRRTNPATTVKSRRTAVAKRTTPVPTEHDIASRAFELFLDRGGGHGRDQDDWLSAEQELQRGQR